MLADLLALQGRSDDKLPSLGPFPSWVWLLVLILDIIVIVFVWTGHKRFTVKVVWSLVIFFLPLLGLVLYVLLGREKS